MGSADPGSVAPGPASPMKCRMEDFMAQKKKRPSLKPVVKAIARTVRQLKRIRRKASLVEKKKLDPKIKAVENLDTLARRICHAKNLSV